MTLTAGNSRSSADHAPVVLERVQPHPRQDVLAGRQVLVERLVHVPQQRDARHNGYASSCDGFIDRYVIREVLLPFFIALLVFTFILIIPSLMQYAEAFIAKGVPTTVVLRVDGHAAAAGARADDSDGAAHRPAGRVRPAVGRPRVRRDAGVRHQPRAAAPAGRRHLALLGWAATSYVMLDRAAGREPGVPRDHASTSLATRAEGEVKPRVFFEELPRSRAVRARHPADRRLERRLHGRQHARGSRRRSIWRGTAAWSSIAKKRTVEMVLEDGTRHVAECRRHLPGRQVRSPGASASDPGVGVSARRAARRAIPR